VTQEYKHMHITYWGIMWGARACCLCRACDRAAKAKAAKLHKSRMSFHNQPKANNNVLALYLSYDSRYIPNILVRFEKN
jgi:hypothetical protein